MDMFLSSGLSVLYCQDIIMVGPYNSHCHAGQRGWRDLTAGIDRLETSITQQAAWNYRESLQQNAYDSPDHHHRVIYTTVLTIVSILLFPVYCVNSLMKTLGGQ